MTNGIGAVFHYLAVVHDIYVISPIENLKGVGYEDTGTVRRETSEETTLQEDIGGVRIHCAECVIAEDDVGAGVNSARKRYSGLMMSAATDARKSELHVCTF